MPSVFVTGDLHGSLGLLSEQIWKGGWSLTSQDFLIVAGDFGALPLWPEDDEDDPAVISCISLLREAPWTTLFVDGNHECFAELLRCPEVDIGIGAPVGEVLHGKVYHLLRGRRYTIYGRTWITLGGAESTDKECRVEGRSWWPQELPNDEELNRAERAIAPSIVKGLRGRLHAWFSKRSPRKGDNESRKYEPCNYILTHAPPAAFNAARQRRQPGRFGDLLDRWYAYSTRKRIFGLQSWFCGHLHTNYQIGYVRVIYNQILLVYKAPDEEVEPGQPTPLDPHPVHQEFQSDEPGAIVTCSDDAGQLDAPAEPEYGPECGGAAILVVDHTPPPPGISETSTEEDESEPGDEDSSEHSAFSFKDDFTESTPTPTFPRSASSPNVRLLDPE